MLNLGIKTLLPPERYTDMSKPELEEVSKQRRTAKTRDRAETATELAKPKVYVSELRGVSRQRPKSSSDLHQFQKPENMLRCYHDRKSAPTTSNYGCKKSNVAEYVKVLKELIASDKQQIRFE